MYMDPPQPESFFDGNLAHGGRKTGQFSVDGRRDRQIAELRA